MRIDRVLVVIAAGTVFTLTGGPFTPMPFGASGGAEPAGAAGAAAAAVAHVGGGTITDQDLNDSGTFEVEVLLDSGIHVEVELSADLIVLDEDVEPAAADRD